MLLATGACRYQDSRDLQEELRRESASSGLALAADSSWYITVFPFDGEERHFRSNEARQLWLLGMTGRVVVRSYRADFLEAYRFLVESIAGERIKEIDRRAASPFGPLALSEAAGRIAFSGKLQGKDKAEGLYWSTFDFSESGFIGEGSNCDWSPDGRYVSYSEAIAGLHIPFVTMDYRLMVSRVHDGKPIVVRESSGTKAGDLNNGFRKILDYRKFCGGCKRSL